MTDLDCFNWQAASWDDHASIWRELVESSNEDVAVFRSRELNAWEAGIVFERWVLEGFRLSKVEVQSSFSTTVRGTQRDEQQIDGLVLFEWQGFLVQSKFWRGPRKVDFGPVALLHVQCEQRAPNTMGLMFAPFGFTVPAIDQAARLRPIRVLLLDSSDLEWAIEHRDFDELVRRKWMAAVKLGIPNHPVDSMEGDVTHV